MAAVERSLPYRGDLSALLARRTTLVFTTTHAEGLPTAIWRIDTDTGELKSDNLPAGATSVVLDDSHVFAAGTDGFVYRGASDGGACKPLGAALTPAPRALALLAGGRLAVLCGAEIVFLSRKDGAEHQRLPLPDEGTAIAASEDGRWLVVGTTGGWLCVYDGERGERFSEGERVKAHASAVSALCFEGGDLRVLSAGTDNRLFSTHVRGRLEPEDRGGKAMHEGAVTGIAWGALERFYTVGRDGVIKVWEKGTSKRRPATVKDFVPVGLAVAVCEYKGRPHLVLAGADRSVRLFALDAAGKVGEPARNFFGATAWAAAELGQSDAGRRESALRAIAKWNDAEAIDLLAAQVDADADHGLRLLSASLLGASGNPRARAVLERLLQHKDEAVRRAALEGLRALDGATALRPLDLALKAKKADIGLVAVQALAGLSSRDDQALARLLGALDEDPVEVRLAALLALETCLPGSPPESTLAGLRSKRPDIRRQALLRGFQRDLLGDPSVQAALRRHGEDSDADVRAMAFWVSVLSRKTLAGALRGRDKDLHRQLYEVETAGRSGDGKLPKAPDIDPKSLSAEDLAPLLQAMASRALDTCLRGAGGLAALQDPRAFGTLLQLSRDPNNAARVSACKALMALGDARAEQRLRSLLRDASPEVRDAAFTALTRLLEGRALDAAEAGSRVEHEDVRRRALELLVREIRSKTAGDRGLALLSRALDDAAAAVRGEAFKASLNLGIGGAGDGPLRFALKSIHAEVRREVLVETEGRITEGWAGALLLDLMGDPDPGLRKDAFDFAVARTKGADLEPLARALRGRYPDLKTEAARQLAKKPSAGAQGLLVEALSDEEQGVRRLAVDALVSAEAAGALTTAMNSRFADVVVRAATARASVGDPDALAPLLALARAPAPELGDKTPWRDRVVEALDGLGALGSADALDAIVPLVDHADANIRKAAARALGAVSPPDRTDALRRALQHADTNVKIEAALGLASCGDSAGASLIFAPTDPKKAPAVPPARALLAAIGIGEAGRDTLLSFLDHADTAVRDNAILLLLLAEWAEGDGIPDRCIAALSSASPRARLLAARALEQFPDAAAFAALLVELWNDRGEGKAAWTVPAATIRGLAARLVGDVARLRLESAALLCERTLEDQAAFERSLRRYESRRGTVTDASPTGRGERMRWDEVGNLVLGAYVGLARLKAGAAEIRIQQTAISRLLALVTRDATLAASVQPVLVQALTDPHQAVRRQAFDGLRGMGMDAGRLGGEALQSDYRDIGALGLALLSENAGSDGETLLESVMLSREGGLEEEAMKLLLTRRSIVAVLAAALNARSTGLREAAVTGLARESAAPAARDALAGALGSRYRHVRQRAAEELATLKDRRAFETLVELLDSDQARDQKRATEALQRLGDPRGPDALLDRVDRDPANTAAVDVLVAGAGSWRSPDTADRLFAGLQASRTRNACFNALLAVSGYDQSILDPEDDGPKSGAPQDWEKRQHPRWDALLARLIDAVYRLGDAGLLGRLIPAARWAHSPVVGESLAPLVSFGDEGVRHRAVEALGWRLRKRKGEVAPLVRALEHPDLTSRFLAAEGLALHGRRDGVGVLLASVDVLEDLDHRTRAVRALGQLADPRALDTLFRLADNEGHALQEHAAEALGHLASSPRAKDIFDLLVRLSDGSTEVAMQALTGLRWFGGHDAWGRIRARVRDDDWEVRQRVAELLAFDDDPASRNALESLITVEDDNDVARAAWQSLQKLLGPDSLEPAYVALKSSLTLLSAEDLARIGGLGDASRLLDLLPELDDGNRDTYAPALEEALLARRPLPVAEATSRLEINEDSTGTLAARILGVAGTEAAGSANALAAALATITTREAEARAARSGPLVQRRETLSLRLGRLIWACSRVPGVPEAPIVALARREGMAEASRRVRGAALQAIAAGAGGDSALDALEAAITGPDADHRALAAAALLRRAPARAAAMVGRVLDDPAALDRLYTADPGALRAGLKSASSQGVVIQHLVALGEKDALIAASRDRSLPESVRLGALEGLARLHDKPADDAIAAVGKDTTEDENLRKAAWRALRRSKRSASRIAEVRA